MTSLCDYSDANILAKRTKTLIWQGADTAAIQADRNNNYAPFTDCITEINNTLVDNAKDIGVVMSMYGLMEYSDN